MDEVKYPRRAKTKAACKPSESVIVEYLDDKWLPTGDTDTVPSLLYCDDGEYCMVNLFGGTPHICSNEGRISG